MVASDYTISKTVRFGMLQLEARGVEEKDRVLGV